MDNEAVKGKPPLAPKLHSQSNKQRGENRTWDQSHSRIAENLIELGPTNSARNETSTEQDEST